MTDDPDDKVILISDAKPSVRIKKPPSRVPYCAHRRLWIIKERRMLECRDCQQHIDPYDYLTGLADTEQNAFATVHAHRKEIEELNSERGRLKSEILGLKAKLGRATKAVLDAADEDVLRPRAFDDASAANDGGAA
jgi:hypothetical protein